MNHCKLAAAAIVSILLAACSSSPRKPEPSPSAPPPAVSGDKAARAVKSPDGKTNGEIVGTPGPNSRFAKLQIGMSMDEIQTVLGRAPDRSHSYESGKRWIPFYFGSDARRVQALYKTEGCLIVTGGNIWGGAGGDLIQIEFDPSGACYQP